MPAGGETAEIDFFVKVPSCTGSPHLAQNFDEPWLISISEPHFEQKISRPQLGHFFFDSSVIFCPHVGHVMIVRSADGSLSLTRKNNPPSTYRSLCFWHSMQSNLILYSDFGEPETFSVFNVV